MDATKDITLSEKWQELKAIEPNIRIRNAAIKLTVTEVELLATLCGQSVARLKPEFQNILAEIESLGQVMALTRNDDIVHERKGVYLNSSLNSAHMGLFVGEDIDLRIFFTNWASAFAVSEGSPESPRKSIQFFAKDGEAIHKIYLTANSNQDAYQQIVEKYINSDQSVNEIVTAPKEITPELPDGQIDIESFRNEWVNLKDTHDFYGMLMKYKLTRTQALRLAPIGNYAIKVNNNSLRNILNEASLKEIPIMVFVGNQGMIQIHTGNVKKIVDMEGWLNVLDPLFNLHVREESIVQSWIVRKPTVDGVVTALECFDSKGVQIVQLFGKRKPGIPEMESWREVVYNIETQVN